MANAIRKARAVIRLEDARKGLIDLIEDAKDEGVSESELMQILHINNYSLHRFLEDSNA